MSEVVFETGINLIETLITTNFVTMYLGTRYKDAKKRIGFMLCWMSAFFEMCIMNRITAFETVGTYIPVLIYFVYSLICLKGSIGLKLWISFLTYLMVYIIAVITNLVICQIIGYNPADMITVFNTTRVTSVIITKIILFYVTRIILKNKYKCTLSKYKWIMIVFMPTISLISLGALMKAALFHPEIKQYILIGMVCIVAADIVTYFFFIVMNKEYENTIKTRLLEQQNENLKSSIEDKDAFVKTMKTVRHDIKNQLLTILQYAEEGRDKEIKEYINALINNDLPNILNYINTGNTAFDAIVNSKIAVCNQKGIFIEVYVEQGIDIKIPPVDMAALFGNLLDNAIEAASETDIKRISVEIIKKGTYLFITVRNSINKSVLLNNKNLETSKSDKKLHGIGVKSVKRIIEKYNGKIQFQESENEFCCILMIDMCEA